MKSLLIPTARRQANEEFTNPATARRIARLPIRIALSLLIISLLVAAGVLAAKPASVALAKVLPRAAAQQPSAPAAPSRATVSAARGASGLAALTEKQSIATPPLLSAPWAMMTLFFQAPPIATYTSDCLTPKNSFSLNEGVCVRVSGAPTSGVQVVLSDPDNFRRGTAFDVTSSSQDFSFTLPSSSSTGSVDNRGTWTVALVNTSDASRRASASFTVHDPQQPVADVTISKTSIDTGQVLAGGNTTYRIYVTNQGPDAATNVSFTDNTLPNSTFVSFVQNSGPTFSCTPPAVGSSGSTVCTKSSMAAGDVAAFTAVYLLNTSVGNGADLTDTVNITSGTFDSHDASNTSTTNTTVSNPSPPACTLSCPANITKTADTTVNGVRGAYVMIESGEAAGDCGAVTSSPAPAPSPGVFFPVGSTPVNVNVAGTQTNASGASCSYSVTITDASPVSITCPAPVNKDAGSDCSVAISAQDLGTPSTSGNGVTLDSDRSDGLALTDPFPVGTTQIIWTATDANNNSKSCTQVVTVTGTDTTPPTVTAPPDVNITTPAGAGGSCTFVVGETELGTPTTSDNCTAAVKVVRTGVPSGNVFPVGQTTQITYTATDSSGNKATATQNVTITDGTPPLIAAPPDATYSCLSDVPAANPSQATGAQTFDDNGNPLPLGAPSDNCGTPTVSVSETSSGTGNAADPLIIKRTFTATDSASNTASAVQTITVVDNTPPTLTVSGGDMTVECHTSFTDPGATATDTCAGVHPVSVSGSVDVNTPGTYTLTYTATDAVGNTASAQRTVTVQDTTPPTLTLIGGSSVTAECHVSFTDPGATAADSCAGDLTAQITKTGSVDVNTPGTYTLNYAVSDGAGHTATAQRTVVVRDTTPPAITLNGASSVTVECHTSYTELGATAVDACDASAAVGITGSVNVNTPGIYTVTYTATDHSNNTSTATRTVNVVDSTKPVITVAGANPMTILLGSTFSDPGATAVDSCAGAVSVTASGTVNTNAVGTYTVTYTATDPSGNTQTATRTVNVIYNFTGFFSPVANLPTLNSVNAGRAIPVKFSLSGNQGLGIFTANSPSSALISCGSNAQSDVTDTLTAGSSSLSYDAGSGQYIYVWKTDSSWAGQCRVLNVTLIDGTTHTALFKFK